MNDLKENKEYLSFVDYAEECIINDEDFEDMAVELYCHESNWNNADPTTRQAVYSRSEIVEFLEQSLTHLKADSDHCSGCGMPLSEEDYITEEQKHPYGDTYATENIVVGYKCINCGDEE